MAKVQRVLGRIDDATWERLKEHAAAQEQSFTDWASSTLIAAADRGERGRDICLGGRGLPPRQLGRMDDATWDRLKRTAADSQLSFTTWAVSILIDAAELTSVG